MLLLLCFAGRPVLPTLMPLIAVLAWISVLGYEFYYISKILIKVKTKKFGIKTLKINKRMGTFIQGIRVAKKDRGKEARRMKTKAAWNPVHCELIVSDILISSAVQLYIYYIVQQTVNYQRILFDNSKFVKTIS